MTDTHGLTAPRRPKKTVTSSTDRALKPALWKGWRRRCPSCGEGALLHSYLKVNDACASCGQELHHHRADDGPAYLTILIVGHLMAPMLHIFVFSLRPNPWVTVAVFSLGCLVSSLYLLPRLKGIVVAYQWAKRMNGFGNG